LARKSRKNIEPAPEQAIQKATYNAGAYIRLSSVDRKQRGDSIENQLALIEAFITECPDIELREVYIDKGRSGQSFERPAFQRMIADMESGKLNCCITKDLSRLGRNAIDAGYYMEKFFPSIGVRYIAVTDNYDSVDGQSGGIMVSLKNMVNEAFAMDCGRKVRATAQMNIRKGNLVSGSPTYGYIKHPDDCHKLIIDEYAAGNVLRMFEMAFEGKSHQNILAWLNDNKVKPPKRYFNSIGLASDKEVGALTEWWSLRAVRDVLSNRIYCGDMVQGKTKKVNYVLTRLPKSEWVIVENTHEAIVNRELFNAVQEAWVRQQTRNEPYFKNPHTENVFARKLFCGQCGRALVRHRPRENYYIYKCNSKAQYTREACGGSSMPENTLKSIMFGMIYKYESLMAQVLSAEANTSATTGVPASDNLNNELAAVRYELDKNKQYFAGLYQSLMDGDISDTEYKDMKAAYEVKITSLTGRVKGLQETILDRAQREKELSQARMSVQRIEQASDLTAEIVDKLVEKIHIYPNKRIGVKFRFMDDVIYSDDGIVVGGIGT
jgi:DNA invertase Pin-like site-specific DNA recombinase